MDLLLVIDDFERWGTCIWIWQTPYIAYIELDRIITMELLKNIYALLLCIKTENFAGYLLNNGR